MNSEESAKQGRPVLAIDLGGTKIVGALISPDFRLIAKERCPTLAGEGPVAVIKRLLSVGNILLEHNNMAKSQLGAISIAAAGAIDAQRGIITVSPNLPGWNNIPIKDIVQEQSGFETFIVNDANAAALGEHRLGAGRRVENLVLLTVGTGIGGGIIINGELYAGSSGSAGEIGHMTIDINGPKCACGNTGCLEVLASGTAIAREARRRIKSKEETSLVEMVNGKIEDVTAKKVGAAAREGDRLSLDIISTAANYLGVGLVSLVNIFNPDIIVIGGGVAELGELLLGPARKLVQKRSIPIAACAVRITRAELGNDAGMFGAAIFAYQQRMNK